MASFVLFSKSLGSFILPTSLSFQRTSVSFSHSILLRLHQIMDERAAAASHLNTQVNLFSDPIDDCLFSSFVLFSVGRVANVSVTRISPCDTIKGVSFLLRLLHMFPILSSSARFFFRRLMTHRATVKIDVAKRWTPFGRHPSFYYLMCCATPTAQKLNGQQL